MSAAIGTVSDFCIDVRHQKFRIKPFLKGLRESKEQSSLAGAHFPYFQSLSQLLYLKQSVRSTQNMLKKQTAAAFHPKGRR